MKTLIRESLFPLIAVAAAFLIGGVIVLAVGDSPKKVYILLISGAFGLFDNLGNFTFDNWGYTLFQTTPLIFTGLAVALALKCGLLNIGAEGQLYVGAFAAAWVGITFAKFPGFVLIPAAMIAAMGAGAVWGAIPGALKARFGSHEVINTIMMNFIAIGLISYLTQRFYKEQGDPIMQTTPIAEQAHIARFSTLLAPFGVSFPQSIPLNVSFLLALLTAFLVWVFLWRTKWGYEIRAVGSNPAAAEYGGVSVRKQIVLAMALSGALAGMVGVNDVLGNLGDPVQRGTDRRGPAARARSGWAARRAQPKRRWCQRDVQGYGYPFNRGRDCHLLYFQQWQHNGAGNGHAEYSLSTLDQRNCNVQHNRSPVRVQQRDGQL